MKQTTDPNSPYLYWLVHYQPPPNINSEININRALDLIRAKTAENQYETYHQTSTNHRNPDQLLILIIVPNREQAHSTMSDEIKAKKIIIHIITLKSEEK
jgi:hypothetical protein